MDEPNTCASCRYFEQHYVRIGKNRYMTVEAGHCTSPRLKDRKAATPACPHYSHRRVKQDGTGK